MSSLGVDTSKDAVEERMNAVAEMCKSGHTVSDIARKLDITERTVWRMKKRAGLTHPHPPITNAQVDEMRAMLDDGMSYSEVSRTLGIDHAAIKRRFPGRGYDQSQSVNARNLRRQLDAIEDQSNRREFNDYRAKQADPELG